MTGSSTTGASEAEDWHVGGEMAPECSLLVSLQVPCDVELGVRSAGDGRPEDASLFKAEGLEVWL